MSLSNLFSMSAVKKQFPSGHFKKKNKYKAVLLSLDIWGIS